MQPRRHRIRKQVRRDCAREWVRSGARVTVKAFAKLYGVDRYPAQEDLIAIRRRWLDRPQELLLGELGRATRIYPELATALRTARPSELCLDAEGAYHFLSVAAPLLDEAGSVFCCRPGGTGAASSGWRCRHTRRWTA